MNSNFWVISNNPQVWEHAGQNCLRVHETPLQVFYKGLDYLAGGMYTFFSHPIAGNERLLRNPFRSLVLHREDEVSDSKRMYQMRLIELYLKKLEEIDFSQIPEAAFEDYQIVDYALFLAGCPST